MDGISVHASRENMGYKLANRIKIDLTAEQLEEIDVVMVSETAHLFQYSLCHDFNWVQVPKLAMIRMATLTPSPNVAYSGDFEHDGPLRRCAPKQALPAGLC